MSDTRLIERWLPIAALGEESVRERRSMTALPPTYYLHVWWARRPLVASRAAVLASMLPEDADRAKFMHAIGIHGDPIATKRRIEKSKKTGEDLGLNPYGYERAFKYRPTIVEKDSYINSPFWPPHKQPIVLDPTAGGGSIPFEAARLGANTLANDLNPVAALIEKATIEYPLKHGSALNAEFKRISKKFIERALPKFDNLFPPEPPDTQVLGYLWARTVKCPYCDGIVPLSPNWRLAADGTGVKLHPKCDAALGVDGRVCTFEIVSSADEHSSGTASDGDGSCCFPDCKRVIDSKEVKHQAVSGGMGEQLFAVVFKRRIETRTKAGKKGRDKWVRGYRAARPEDNNSLAVKARVEASLPDWEALDLVPTERFPEQSNDERPIQYGMPLWRDMFSPRQLIGHVIGVEVYREILAEEESKGLSELTRAVFAYLALSLDKFRDYNSRMTRWHSKREVIVNTFDRHDFAFKWSYAEMAPLVVGSGFAWVIEQTTKCIGELVDLVGVSPSDLFSNEKSSVLPSVAISCKSGDDLQHIDGSSVDIVVMDPPYYDNVMYAELSDFFYVWLKRTAGYVTPELFTRYLTDKEGEAVANTAKYQGQKGAKVLAGRDYQERMAHIFEECRRVLKSNGIMTLMFTHKATGAWDALTTGLMKAGFSISASWPVNTESESSLHIKDKSAANSTVFLVCRPRLANSAGSEKKYWEDVEPQVAAAVRKRVPEFQAGGITGVDLYLASFGPALEEFSKHWPLQRGTPRSEPAARKRRLQAEIFDEIFDPYAVTPEDALEAARREVKTWRLNQLMHMRGKDDLDPVTSWFILAWDAFKAPLFAYDEGLRLARAVGVDLDSLIGRLCEKKGSDLKLWDSAARAAKGSLGPVDGSQGMLDVIHHVAHLARTRSVDDAVELLARNRLAADPGFLNALEAVLEVLPPSKSFSGFDVAIGDAKASADDFDALERLRRVAFADVVDQPKQLELFIQEVADAQVAAE